MTNSAPSIDFPTPRSFSLSAWPSVRAHLTMVNILSALLLFTYLYFFIESLPLWFHPGWTTDDALQQLFPFHEVYHPGIFRGDLITEVMEGYLAPLHYWSTYIVTLFVGDPIMAGHSMMLIQLVLASLFLFFAVQHRAGFAAGCLAVLWLLHSREIIQRMTAGLPRGWALVVLTSYLCFVLRGKHRLVLLALFAGCLLHPPTTMIAALSYGLYLVIGAALPKSRAELLRPLIWLLVLSPLYLGVTYSVVKRPDTVGQMVTKSEAQQMPQFQFPDGRFVFLPLASIGEELRTFGFQVFVSRLHETSGELQRWLRNLVPILLVALIVIGWLRRRSVLPLPIVTLLLSIAIVYLLSRELAFLLYVPNRHLQFPLAVFWIGAFMVAAWRAFHLDGSQLQSTTLRTSAVSLLAVLGVVGLSFLGSGDGLQGSANFNYSTTKKGYVFEWIREKTPPDSLVAGHPTFINGVMLFGMRRGFATTETYHPFYRRYMEEMERRLAISFRAHYATSAREFLEVLEPDGIDYFIFERKRFYPFALAQEKYFPPLDTLVRDLASQDPDSYFYKRLPRELDLVMAPYLVFRDDQGVVVDVKALRESVDSGVIQ